MELDIQSDIKCDCCLEQGVHLKKCSFDNNCNYSICEECIFNLIDKTESIRCPACREIIFEEEEKNINIANSLIINSDIQVEIDDDSDDSDEDNERNNRIFYYFPCKSFYFCKFEVSNNNCFINILKKNILFFSFILRFFKEYYILCERIVENLFQLNKIGNLRLRKIISSIFILLLQFSIVFTLRGIGYLFNDNDKFFFCNISCFMIGILYGIFLIFLFILFILIISFIIEGSFLRN